MECKCEERLNHSKVLASRFRWAKRLQVYEKYRRRECLKCGGRFSTVEVYKKDLTYHD